MSDGGASPTLRDERIGKMKEPAWKSLVITIGLGVLSIAGCGEKEAPSVRQSRAIAAENIQLQKDLDRSNARIDNIKKQYDKELERQQKLLEKCQKEREDLREKSRQNVRDQVKGVFDSVMVDNTRLREENAMLKAQIEKDKK
jgi:hypothetical protein